MGILQVLDSELQPLIIGRIQNYNLWYLVLLTTSKINMDYNCT